MKDKLRLLMGVGLLTPLFAFAPVAVAGHEADETHAHTQETEIASTHEEQESTPAERAAELKTRLTERKATLKIRLTAAQKNRIQNRCKAAQGKVSSISGRVKGLETSRTQVYTNLLDRLTKASQKLRDKGLDTTELDAQITELQGLVETFNTDLEAYKQAIEDLEILDCQDDPEAFQASLDAARLARAKVKEDAQAIRTLLADTIKPTIGELRAQLEKDEATEGGETE